MYKVFVDHKPIIFAPIPVCEGRELQVSFMNLPVNREELKRILEPASLEKPLYVSCMDTRDCFKSYFREYKKIKAAGGIVRRKEKYLIIKRNGLWDIPKGKIEKGEDRELAAVREIEEECGIRGPVVVRYITRTYHIFKYRGQDAIKTTYWYEMSYSGPKETSPQRDEGISKVKWVSLQELLGIRGKTYGSINELLNVFESEAVD